MMVLATGGYNTSSSSSLKHQQQQQQQGAEDSAEATTTVVPDGHGHKSMWAINNLHSSSSGERTDLGDYGGMRIN